MENEIFLAYFFFLPFPSAFSSSSPSLLSFSRHQHQHNHLLLLAKFWTLIRCLVFFFHLIQFEFTFSAFIFNNRWYNTLTYVYMHTEFSLFNFPLHLDFLLERHYQKQKWQLKNIFSLFGLIKRNCNNNLQRFSSAQLNLKAKAGGKR